MRAVCDSESWNTDDRVLATITVKFGIQNNQVRATMKVRVGIQDNRRRATVTVKVGVQDVSCGNEDC